MIPQVVFKTSYGKKIIGLSISSTFRDGEKEKKCVGIPVPTFPPADGPEGSSNYKNACVKFIFNEASEEGEISFEITNYLTSESIIFFLTDANLKQLNEVNVLQPNYGLTITGDERKHKALQLTALKDEAGEHVPFSESSRNANFFKLQFHPCATTIKGDGSFYIHFRNSDFEGRVGERGFHAAGGRGIDVADGRQHGRRAALDCVDGGRGATTDCVDGKAGIPHLISRGGAAPDCADGKGGSEKISTDGPRSRSAAEEDSRSIVRSETATRPNWATVDDDLESDGGGFKLPMQLHNLNIEEKEEPHKKKEADKKKVPSKSATLKCGRNIPPVLTTPVNERLRPTNFGYIRFEFGLHTNYDEFLPKATKEIEITSYVESECRLCDKRNKLVPFIWCGHAVVCYACVSFYFNNKCPFCSEAIKGFLK